MHDIFTDLQQRVLYNVHDSKKSGEETFVLEITNPIFFDKRISFVLLISIRVHNVIS